MENKILFVLLLPFRAAVTLAVMLYDRFWPAKALVQREKLAQESVDAETRGLILYEFETCPFCVKVRRHAQSLGLNIERRDVKRSAAAKEELLQGGREYQVPCLRIALPADGV